VGADLEEIGIRFRNLREYLRKTQPELAKELGISKQTISAIESEGRGLTRERIQVICDRYGVDARYFFGQLEAPEEADISKRGDVPGLSQTEALRREIADLKKSVRPIEKLDQIAERVMINQPLHDLVEMIQFWDAATIRRFQDIAYGFISGKNFAREDPTVKKENAG
jgi:transcriptional regulator with XRE-family HTH domain